MNNVYFLKNNQNDMHLTIEDLAEKIRAGRVKSLAIAAEIQDGDQTHIHSGYVIDDDAELFRLIGTLYSLMRRLDEENEIRYLESAEGAE